jgi:acetyltransferase-like isoleucine patch superfamily enzyme
LGRALATPGADWYRLCRTRSTRSGTPTARDTNPGCRSGLSAASRAALLTLDPHNITLEPEYYAEVDAERFARVKPLLWLWYSFDRTPAGAQNVELGVGLRRLLAPNIFARCGKNFKCFQHVEFSFGYNMVVGDDCVVHRHVLLDDRGASRWATG